MHRSEDGESATAICVSNKYREIRRRGCSYDNRIAHLHILSTVSREDPEQRCNWDCGGGCVRALVINGGLCDLCVFNDDLTREARGD